MHPQLVLPSQGQAILCSLEIGDHSEVSVSIVKRRDMGIETVLIPSLQCLEVVQEVVGIEKGGQTGTGSSIVLPARMIVRSAKLTSAEI